MFFFTMTFIIYPGTILQLTPDFISHIIIQNTYFFTPQPLAKGGISYFPGSEQALSTGNKSVILK